MAPHEGLLHDTDVSIEKETLLNIPKNRITKDEVWKFISKSSREALSAVNDPKIKDEFLEMLIQYLVKIDKDSPMKDVDQVRLYVKDGHKVTKSDPYKTPYEKALVVQRSINENLAKGWIRRSISACSSPTITVPKKTYVDPLTQETVRELRVVYDYREVNSHLVDYHGATPNPDTILDHLRQVGPGGLKYFASIDMAAAFNQCEMHPESIWLTAFTTQFGIFEWKRLPFGLGPAPGWLGHNMNMSLSMLISDGILVIFFDDMLTRAATARELLENLKKMFSQFIKHNILIKPGKCEFFVTKTVFLGHELSEKGIRPATRLIEKGIMLDKPMRVKDARAYMGLLNYLMPYFKDFSTLMRPLRKAVAVAEKEMSDHIIWSPACEQMYQHCADYLESIGHLQYFKPGPVYVFTDASDFAVGAVATQFELYEERGTGKEMINILPVMFTSKTLSKSEQKWSAGSRELKAIQVAVEKFSDLLYNRVTTVFTDHSSLLSKQGKNPTTRCAVVLDYMVNERFNLKFIPGKDNVFADGASRVFCQKTDDEVKATIEPPISANLIYQNVGITTKPISPYKIEASRLLSPEEIEALRNPPKPPKIIVTH